jgi:hypothetical protein
MMENVIYNEMSDEEMIDQSFQELLNDYLSTLASATFRYGVSIKPSSFILA